MLSSLFSVAGVEVEIWSSWNAETNQNLLYIRYAVTVLVK